MSTIVEDRDRVMLQDLVRRRGVRSVDSPQALREDLAAAEGIAEERKNALLKALDAGIPAQIRATHGRLSVSQLAGITQSFAAESGLAFDDAFWAIESWAASLGKVTNPFAQGGAPSPTPEAPRVLTREPAQDREALPLVDDNDSQFGSLLSNNEGEVHEPAKEEAKVEEIAVDGVKRKAKKEKAPKHPEAVKQPKAPKAPKPDSAKPGTGTVILVAAVVAIIIIGVVIGVLVSRHFLPLGPH